MRVVTEEIKIFAFQELSEASKEKALDRYRYINVECNWFEFFYEDIKTHLGIEVTNFNLDPRGQSVDFDFRHENINNKFLKGLTSNYPDCLCLIDLTEYYLSEFDRMDKLDFSVDQIENSLYSEAKEVRKDLESVILRMLTSDFEYRTSNEAIIDTFEANEYEFKENGEIY